MRIDDPWQKIRGGHAYIGNKFSYSYKKHSLIIEREGVKIILAVRTFGYAKQIVWCLEQ